MQLQEKFNGQNLMGRYIFCIKAWFVAMPTILLFCQLFSGKIFGIYLTRNVGISQY